MSVWLILALAVIGVAAAFAAVLGVDAWARSRRKAKREEVRARRRAEADLGRHDLRVVRPVR
jgi:hypothetical protein